MKPSIGRIVHLTTDDGCTAAIVTRVPDEYGCDLFVMRPRLSDWFYVRASEDKKQGSEPNNGTPGTWHWPERE